MRTRAAMLGALLAVGCQTPRAQIRQTAESASVPEAMRMYRAHVARRGAPNPDALSDVALAVLRRGASSDDARERAAAFSALRSLGPAARGPLAALARVPGVVGDRAVALGFDLGGHEGPVPARLDEALHSEDAERRVAGLAALEARHDDAGLIAALRDGSPDVRRAAAMRLARSRGSAPASAALAEGLLHDDDPGVRAQCALALGSHGQAGLGALEGAMGDDDVVVQLTAVASLASASTARARVILPPLLARPPSPLTLEVARVLAERGDTVAARYILAALDDPRPATRAQAAVEGSSLPPAFAPDLAPHIEDADPEVRLRVAAVLGRDDAFRARALRALRPLALQPDPDMAVRALNALAELRDPEAVGPLREALRAPSVTVRRIAVLAWSRLAGTTGDNEALAPLLEDPDKQVRLAAAAEVVRIAMR